MVQNVFGLLDSSLTPYLFKCYTLVTFDLISKQAKVRPSGVQHQLWKYFSFPLMKMIVKTSEAKKFFQNIAGEHNS